MGDLPMYHVEWDHPGIVGYVSADAGGDGPPDVPGSFSLFMLHGIADHAPAA